MKTAVLNKIRGIVLEKSGISLGSNKEALVSSRVSKRLKAMGISDYGEYLQILENDTSGDELVRLLDVITTNVTYFFREPDHFELLDELASDWLKKGHSQLRIWSSACSSGEEPYTIAMVLKKALGNRLSDAKILATDLSPSVLEEARAGQYSKKKLKNISERSLKIYFNRHKTAGDNVYIIKNDLKKIMTFGRLNLSTPPFPMKGEFDIIFCRNVMIYFSQEVRQNLIIEFERMLKVGGYLMVGHSESLTGQTTRLKRIRPSVYFKE